MHGVQRVIRGGIAVVVVAAALVGLSGTARGSVTYTPGLTSVAASQEGQIVCPSGTECLMFGQGVITPLNDGAQGSPIPYGGNNQYVSASCPATGTCFAAGSQGPAPYSAVVAPLSSSGVVGANLTTLPGYSFTEIACGSTTDCIAIANVDGGPELFVVHIVNGAVVSSVPAPSQVQPNPPFDNFGVAGIACESANHCEADGFGVVFPIINGQPGTVTSLNPHEIELNGVTCATATLCYAYGAEYDTGAGHAVVYPIVNGVLGQEEVVPTPADVASQFFQIDCVTALTCVGTGDWFTASNINPPPYQPLSVELFDGTMEAPQLSSVGTFAHGIGCQYQLPVDCTLLEEDASGNNFYTQNLTVSGVNTTTTLTVSPSAPTYGQAITLTATVTPEIGAAFPPEPVQFFEDNVLIGSATPVNGVATYTVTGASAGVHTFGAGYAGDVDYEPSGTPFTSVTVAKAPTMLVAAPEGLIATSLSAKLTRPSRDNGQLAGQPINFSIGSTIVCTAYTNAQGVASCSVIALGLGASYSATFSGSSNYLGSHSTAAL